MVHDVAFVLGIVADWRIDIVSNVEVVFDVKLLTEVKVVEGCVVWMGEGGGIGWYRMVIVIVIVIVDVVELEPRVVTL